METLKPAEVILKAAQLLKEKGWIQNVSKTEKGFCSLGAITEIMGDDIFDNKKWESVVGVLAQEIKPEAMDSYSFGRIIVEYNDALGRTKEEVIQLLRKVGTELSKA